MKNYDIPNGSAPAVRVGVVAAACFFFSVTVIASESRPPDTIIKKDVSSELSALRGTVRSAEVYLVAPDSTFRYNFGEIDVLRVGCHYVVNAPADIESLIDVLFNARLSQVPVSKEEYDARFVIRFHQDDSRFYTLILGPDYSNANSRGEYLRDGNAIPVEATHSIEKDLRFWASQHRTLSTKPCPH